jgi:hypothetical protein
MSVAKALKAAVDAGVRVRVDGDDLELSAPSQPPFQVIALLSRNKAEIVRVLREAFEEREDWQAFFNERAAIAEYEGLLPRRTAEANAFARCIVEWVRRNCPVVLGSFHGRYGVESAVRIRRCSQSWPVWRPKEIFQAMEALKRMGIPPPEEFS